MKLVSTFLLAAIASSSLSQEMKLGDIDALPMPTDEQYKKMHKATEYYTGVKKLVTIQKEIIELQQGNAEGANSSSVNSSSFNKGTGIPRHLRGTSQGDSFVNNKGELVVKQTSPKAYLSSVSGLNGNLTAEVFWGDRLLPVSKGDTLLGGNWKVKAVNTDDLVLTNGLKTVRLGVVPVDIDSLVQ